MDEILDVGCGIRPMGDVNVDLYLGETWHRETGKIKIDPKKVRNFVKADALHLPFKSNAFKLVYCSHVIEHVEDPTILLKELIRVAEKKVKLKLPHAWSREGHLHRACFHQKRSHKNFFRSRWFHQTLKNYYHECDVSFKPVPHYLLPLIMWPSTITVKIHLGKKI